MAGAQRTGGKVVSAERGRPQGVKIYKNIQKYIKVYKIYKNTKYIKIQKIQNMQNYTKYTKIQNI